MNVFTEISLKELEKLSNIKHINKEEKALIDRASILDAKQKLLGLKLLNIEELSYEVEIICKVSIKKKEDGIN